MNAFNPPPMDLRKLTEQVTAISVDVASFIRSEAGKLTDARVSAKSANNLVTHVDHVSEDRLVEGLEKLLPEAGFIAEEGSGEQRERLNWVIDPLDGTTNFVHGVPCYCISIALLDGTEPLLGVVHEVTRDERFTAWRGGGAYLNGLPIRVSERTTLQDSLLATGFPYDDFGYESEYMDLLRELMHRTRGLCGLRPLRGLLRVRAEQLGRGRRCAAGARGGRTRKRVPPQQGPRVR